jgi:putative transposase
MAKPSRNTDPSQIQDGQRTFFVTSKTILGRSILQPERMASLFIDVLRSYAAAKKFRLHDFVVMPNHFHLLLTLNKDMTVEKAAQLVKGISLFAQKRNWGLNAKSGSPASLTSAYGTARAFSAIATTSTTIQ